MNISNTTYNESILPGIFAHSGRSTAANIVMIVVFIGITVWTIFGNLTVIISVKQNAALRASPSNFLVANLALSDFLLGLTILPFSAVVEVSGYWPMGRELCFIWLIIDVLLCTASIWGLVVIAVDRYTATFKPIWYRTQQTNRRTGIYIATVWVISTLTSIPPLFGFGSMTQNSYSGDLPSCTLFERLDFVMYSSSMTFIVPAAFLVLIYGRIFTEIRRRSKESIKMKNISKMAMQPTSAEQHQKQQAVIEDDNSSSSQNDRERPNQPQETPTSTSHDEHGDPASEYEVKLLTNAICSDIEYQNSTDKQVIHKTEDNIHKKEKLRQRTASKRRKDCREERATRIMLAVMLFFIVCWLPFFTMYITRSALSVLCPDCVPVKLQIFLTWLGYINSAVNPILYAAFNRQFKDAFRNVWCGKLQQWKSRLVAKKFITTNKRDSRKSIIS